MLGLPIGWRLTRRIFATLPSSIDRATATIVLMLLVFPTLWSADKRIRPLSHEAVAQVWLGVSEDELYVFRLALNSDGTGLGGYVFPDDEPRLFRIESWRFEPPRFDTTVSGTGGNGTDIEYLKGTLIGVAMDLRVGGRGWERKLSLRREGDLTERWEKLRAAMSPAK
jgi:hypothetical protein